MSAKAFRRMRTALIIVFILAALYATYRYTLHRMVEAKLNEIRKAGYPVTLAELDKWYPQVPAGENAADVYLEALALFAKPSRQESELVSMAWAQHLHKCGEPLPAEIERGVSNYLVANAKVLSL